MAEYQFNIPGKPVAKGRPRSFRAGNRIIVATPEATRKWERMAALEMKVQMKGRPMLTGLLWLNANFYFKSAKEGCRIERPDIDNLIKSAMDAMSGIVFADDAAIVSITANKVNTKKGTAMTMLEIGEERK